jgi:beta-lactam-binding protein with PASTA domain
MRTCQSCGRENPDDADFCGCGEYLRWEPTGFLQAITPTRVERAAAAPPPPKPIPRIAKTLVHGAVPPPQPPAAPPQHEPATIVLRLPEGEPAKGETLHQQVEPGLRERVLALVRNQSGIVDNYDLRVEGMPDDWWSIYPGTVYLVPFGSGGTYEQEVEVHLHPPKSPLAEAKVWDLRVVAQSKAQSREAASAPLALHVLPYVETVTTLRPQRKKGRRKADFDVTVTNKANAPVLVALEGEDPDGELQFGFNRPPQEIPAGAAVASQMRVKPPKQIWIGRPQDRRLEVKTITGEEAAERAAADPLAAEVLAQPGGFRRRGLLRRRVPDVPGVYPPRVYRPQLYPPGATIGPGGLQLRMPKLQAPHVQGPQMKQVQLKPPQQLKLPGRGGGSSAPAAPLLPTQGIFRQKGWIPWWAVPLLIAIVALLLLLYKLSPQKVVVPQIVGQRSAFKAEEKLTNAKLKLDPAQKKQLDAKVPPGTIIGQTPKAGSKAAKGDTVAVLVAVASAKVNVPNIVGLTAGDAEKALRAKNLTLGQASPQPIDPAGKISSQIPAANEVVKQGTPVNIFYPNPAANKGKASPTPKGKGNGKKGGAAAAAAAAGAAGAGPADIVVPAVAGAKLDAFAKTVADKGIVPVEVKQFNDAPVGTLFATDPPGGTKVAKGAHVKLLVSVGQPHVIFSNGKDIKQIDGATGKPLDPVADGPQAESQPTYSADATHVAYVADGRIMLEDLTKKNAAAVPLTPAGDFYSDLAWAPTADVNALAMSKTNGDPATATDSDLCLAQITKDPLAPKCFAEPDFSVSRAVHWAPNGRSILAFGLKNDASAFGMVRWRLRSGKPAFSTDPADWGKGHFVTDLSQKGKGAIDAEISPDGKQLAVVANFGTGAFRLWLAKDPNDFLLTNATLTPVRACKLAWRGDSQELMVIQSSATCGEEVGSLVRVPVNSVRDEKTLNPSANDPSYQPVNIGG